MKLTTYTGKPSITGLPSTLICFPNLLLVPPHTPGWKDTLRANLNGMIFAYNCSLRLAHIMSATQIMSSKSVVQYRCGSSTQNKKRYMILKHALKPYPTIKMLE